ncbi:hypothetical protein ACNYS0_20125 [Streptomyces sp. BH034]|uniref:hypothetical protein n=1 Tax=Streptomyces sp. BH034 TaxID=3402626 RepID=UPI003BB64002
MSNPSPPRPPVDPVQLRAAVEQLHRALCAYVEAIRPALEHAAKQLATIAAAVEKARTASRDDYALAPPRDRPAWQSPYDPPANNHRK